MKKAIIVLLVLALLAGLGIWGYTYFQENYHFFAKEVYSREIRQLDSRGEDITAEEYEQLCAELPDCDIRWSVPFQGGKQDSYASSLQIDSLTEEDLAQLAYFPRLESVDADECREYDLIFRLMEEYPQCEVSYTVALDGKVYPKDTQNLVISNGDLEELKEKLPYLPQVQMVTMMQPVTDKEALDTLLENYPQITFRWQVNVCGRLVDSQQEELDLSGIVMEDTVELEKAVAMLPKLRKVLMIDCGISNEEMDALNMRWENIKFVWTVVLNQYITVRTDITSFMPIGHFGFSVFTEDCYNLRYCHDIICLDIGHQPVYACDFVQYMPHLKYLILADTRVKDITAVGTLKELVFLELFLTPVEDLSPLVGCTALEDLNICYVAGDADDPEDIATISTLKRLWWSQAGIEWKTQLMLREKLPNTKMNFSTKSSTGDWRYDKHYYDMRDALGMPYMRG